MRSVGCDEFQVTIGVDGLLDLVCLAKEVIVPVQPDLFPPPTLVGALSGSHAEDRDEQTQDFESVLQLVAEVLSR